MPEALPQELIDKIIDAAAENEESDGYWAGYDVLQCSLVSRSFRPRSQRHIFLGIDRDRALKHKGHLQTFYEILEDHTQIANYIEILCLSSFELEELHSPLIDVMKKISPLRTLMLGTDSAMGPVDLEIQNSGPMLNKIFLPFIAPSITSLEICCLLQVPVGVVTSCANLISLTIRDAKLRELSEPLVPNITQPAFKLKHLSHQGTPDSLDILLQPSFRVILSQLKSFAIATHRDEKDLDQLQAIMDLSSDYLEEVNVVACRPYEIVVSWGNLNFKRLSRLRSFHFRIPNESRYSTIDKSLKFISGMLSTIRTGLLEPLLIELEFVYSDDFEVVYNVDWARACSEITRVLAATDSAFEFKMSSRYRGAESTLKPADNGPVLKTACQSILTAYRGGILRSMGEISDSELLPPANQGQIVANVKFCDSGGSLVINFH